MFARKLALCMFLISAAFVMRAGGQEKISAIQQDRFERALNWTPFAEINFTSDKDQVSIVSKPPFTPTGKAFHSVGFYSPMYSFSGPPNGAPTVRDGVYRAEGNCRWYGDAAVWHIVVNTPSIITPLASNGIDASLTTASYYLSIRRVKDDRLVLSRGTELRPVKVTSANMIMTIPPQVIFRDQLPNK